MNGGDDRDRTDDLYVANVPLSQLSYIPTYGLHCLLLAGKPSFKSKKIKDVSV